ncbi:hypothetical protein AFE_1143 [Acidithiobacillus ferrooxidans ATCC 23270]|uniref:Uncharacterized protein n=1 Tax=Acidithiobacillus ferrooxidans (strain ATCC 23270 / DSM 14882 / CIP 104768 / NCIMB 8455) TaxID=243159 RepID=B7J891_ACIF2|nr:hypothetical protein AFE_1143 [Acidithiobacillus ferrooxidans ATCC 23270]
MVSVGADAASKQQVLPRGPHLFQVSKVKLGDGTGAHGLHQADHAFQHLLINRHQVFEDILLIPVPLPHPIILGHRSRSDLDLEGLDLFLDGLHGLSGLHGLRIRIRMFPGRRRQMLRAPGLLTDLPPPAQVGQKFRDLAANQQIVRAKLVLFAVGVVSPALIQVFHQPPDGSGVADAVNVKEIRGMGTAIPGHRVAILGSK